VIQINTLYQLFSPQRVFVHLFFKFHITHGKPLVSDMVL
jgi:hypothetical protein